MSYTNPYWTNMPSWGSQDVRQFGDSTGPFDEQPRGLDMNQMNQAYGGFNAGLSAGQAFGTTQTDFRISGGNILGAAGTGAASGAASGGVVGAAVGAIVGGATSYFKQDKALKENIEKVNTSFDGQIDIYGRPVYNSNQFAQGFADLRGLNDGVAKVNRAPIGVRRLRQLGNKRNELYRNIQQGQQAFNTSDTNFRSRQLQMQEYLERQNDYNRIYNVQRFS